MEKLGPLKKLRDENDIWLNVGQKLMKQEGQGKVEWLQDRMLR